MKKKITVAIIISLIFMGIGAFINFFGAKWGLPNSEHLYSYHPDEGLNLGVALKLFGGAKEPGFYNYSTLYFSLVAYALTVASSWGVLNLNQEITPETLSAIYMTARVTSLIFSILAIGLVFWAAYRIKGLKCAIITGLIYISIPILAMHSKFIAVDVTCGFFLALTIFASTFIKFDTEKINPFAKENKKSFFIPMILTGVSAGLAMGVKYNGLIIFIIPLSIMIFTLIKKKISLKDFILMFIITGCATLITFFITTPGIFLNTQCFIKDFTYELNHMKQGHGLEFVNTGSGFLYNFRENMFWGMGSILSFAALISIIYSFVALKFKKTSYSKNFIGFLCFFAVIYYITISTGNVRFARYIIPALPAFALIVGAFLTDIYNSKNIILKCLCACGIVIMLFQSFTLSLKYDYFMNLKETRDTVLEQNLNYIPLHSQVALPTVPWFYSPPFVKESSVIRQQRYDFAMNCEKYNLLCEPEEENEWNVKFLKEKKPETVLISSIEEFHRKRVNDPKYMEYIKYLNDNYELKTPYPNLYVNKYLKALSYPTEKKYPPSDITYIQPTYYIYIRLDYTPECPDLPEPEGLKKIRETWEKSK